MKIINQNSAFLGLNVFLLIKKFRLATKTPWTNINSFTMNTILSTFVPPATRPSTRGRSAKPPLCPALNICQHTRERCAEWTVSARLVNQQPASRSEGKEDVKLHFTPQKISYYLYLIIVLFDFLLFIMMWCFYHEIILLTQMWSRLFLSFLILFYAIY